MYERFDGDHNGEFLSIYEPTDETFCPPDTVLLFHVNDAAASLNRDDLVRLRDALNIYLSGD